MKKSLLALGVLGVIGLPARADITTKLQSSVQLSVNAAATQVERIGSTFSISGSNIDTTDGTTAGTVSAGTITSGVYSPGTIAATQDTAGGLHFPSVSLILSTTQSRLQAPSVGSVHNRFANKHSLAGVAGDLGWYNYISGCSHRNGNWAGTTATGQFVSEVTVGN